MYWADLNPVIGSEQGGKRPVLIIQNNYGNEYSGTIIVAPISSAQKKLSFPTHVEVGCSKKMRTSSAVLLEQIRTIDKDRVDTYICTLNTEDMKKVDEAIKISLALNKEERSEKLNELQIFKNEQFGEIRMMLIGEEPWFIGKDVATALGYSNTRDALMAHIEEEDKNTVAIPDGNRGNPKQVVINESGLYALIFGSRLSSAKKFKHWVTSEVLPSIRKTGGYSMKPMNTQEQIKLLAQGNMELEKKIDSVNERVDSLEKDMPLYGCEIDEIQGHINRKGVSILGGKESKAYRDASIRGSVYGDMYRQLKCEFGAVASYKSIKRKYIADVHEFIDCYEPPVSLQERIKIMIAEGIKE